MSLPNTTLTANQIIELFPILHKSKRTLHVQGEPGVGKSCLPYQYAQRIGYPVKEVRPARMNPVDVTGLPTIVDMKTVWTRPEIIMEGPCILFIDEIAAAARLMQVCLYEVTLDRRIGQYELHPDSMVVTAGNRPEDAAHVEKMSSALRGRLVAVTLRADLESFQHWAARNGLHPMVSGFLKFRAELLSKFNGKTWDGSSAWPSPRSWHSVSDLMLSGLDKVSTELRYATLEGTVGAGAAREFEGYLAVHHRIISPEMVILDPMGAKVPDDKVEMWATAGSMSAAMTPENAEALATYLLRLPEEFTMFAMKAAIGRNRDLVKVPKVKSWSLANQKILMGR